MLCLLQACSCHVFQDRDRKQELTFMRQMTWTAVIAAIALAPGASRAQDQMISAFYDMSATSFSVQVIAPPDRVRELAICKAIWFAEKKHAEKISLSNPHYGPPKDLRSMPARVPDGWVVLNATAYLDGSNPDGNPLVSVAERAASCRAGWAWYR
jgi:hypothetical protein